MAPADAEQAVTSESHAVGDRMGATQYVAFLRAVNVGGRVVKMTELKKIFEGAGLEDVSTFIASGNVIFASAKPPQKLEPQIQAALQKERSAIQWSL